MIYMLLLIVSLLIGHFIKMSACPGRRKQLVTFVGVVIVAVVCRLDGLHALISAMMNGIIVSVVNPKYVLSYFCVPM